VVVDASKVTEVQLARFVAEAQITGQLQHPNIVPVHEMGLSGDGQPYFVMKKVEGRSLGEVIAALRTGDASTAAEWGRHRLLVAFIQICNAVAYAHDRGVLHRDLKPDNVMLGPFGEVLVMDWGVARLMRDDSTEFVTSEAIERLTMVRTMDGAAIGTPGFMSPEQSLGMLSELDGRSDIWSLGAILYEILTLQPAYSGPNLFALMYAATSGPPVDPRERAPERNIRKEVAAICLRAMASEPGDRFETAAELSSAMEAFLEGSKRREAALSHLTEAEAIWGQYGALAVEREGLVAQEKELIRTLDPWVPLTEKTVLRAVRHRLGMLQPQRARLFGEVLAACEQALSQDPDNPDARNLLAQVHYARLEEAEAARNEEDRLYHEDRVRAFDNGRYAALLEGAGTLTLRTEPSGAKVVCDRYDTSADLVWPLVGHRDLGTTPLEAVPLEQGSYLLTIRCPGRRDTHYPVFIPRGRHWDSGDQPVPLYADKDIGRGMAYVPPGPFVFGGDEQAQDALALSESWLGGFFMSVLPVTMEQYCGFIRALAVLEPEEAWSRVPRQGSGPRSSGGQYWEQPGPGEAYRIPKVDQDGDQWDPRWPVSGVSWDDAQAYAEWRSECDGVLWSLPTEEQWEKAARGVDTRTFPWGNGFDPTLTKMRDSREGRPQPEAVGTFSTDASPYRVHDLGGSMRDWCGNRTYGDDPARRPVRGGSYGADARFCRATCRYGIGPWNVRASCGFRLVRPAAPSEQSS
jgi:eukaryotic-like serine/threonine-protein kinase